MYISPGIVLVWKERVRQIEREQYSPSHDDEQLVSAAISMSVYHSGINGWSDPPIPERPPANLWPWDPAGWKPKSRKENLIRAAALITAEIDRLIRIENEVKETGG